MKKIEKVGILVSNALGYPVWIVKVGHWYKIQKINDGNFYEYNNEVLLFENLNAIIEYFTC